jgi:hypothetical protein
MPLFPGQTLIAMPLLGTYCESVNLAGLAKTPISGNAAALWLAKTIFTPGPPATRP